MSDADSTLQLRPCKRCGEEKQISEFDKNKKCRDGHLATCKACRRDYSRSYYEAHADKIRNRVKEWRLSNPDRCKENAEKWAENNKEKVAEIKRQWRERNREKENAKAVERRKLDPSARRAANIKYYKANRERYRTYLRNRRAAMRKAPGLHSHKDIEDLLRLQRGMCANCGERLNGKHDVDHIYPISKGGSNDPSNLQLLCGTCNRSKGAKDPIEFAQRSGKLL